MLNNKLNNQLVIKLTTFEKERLQRIANELGMSLNMLCRCLLNKEIEEIMFRGIKSFTVRLIGIKESKRVGS